jgi:trypsin-like peptidase
MNNKSQKVESRGSSVEGQKLLCAAIVVVVTALAATRSHAQCYVDPVSGQRICALTPQSGVDSPALDPRLSTLDHSAHCRITVADGSAGSGTLVRRSSSTGLVLTCAHLFDDATGRIIVTFAGGQRFAARLVERDRAHDLAALLIRRPDVEPVAVSDEEPSGVLSACGYGPNGQLHCFRGNITGAAIAAGAVHPSLTIAGAARPGDSGGGVLNTSGQLVGVVWGQRDGHTYATCGRPVHEFLKRILSRSAGQPPRAPGDRFSRVPSRPGVVDPEHGIVDSGEDIESRIKARFDAIEKHLKQIATEKDGLFQGLSIGKLLVGALGLSGPLAAAVIIAGGLAGRRVKKRIANDAKVESTANGAHWPERQRPIAVDTPPPPQRTVPETHYVSVEKDSFAKAHQWACEQVARKYPGATEILQAQDSLIKQHLAAQ